MTSLTELISIDSSDWIERFTKGPKAPQYKQVIESTPPKEILTSVVVLYEVYKKVKKLKSEEEALLAVAALAKRRLCPLIKHYPLKQQISALKTTCTSQTQ